MNLLASTLWGGLYLVLLFGICFGIVVGSKAILLRRARKNQPQVPEKPAVSTEPEKPKRTSPEKVYYIVEKKRTRKSSAKYSEPKKIKFEQ